MQQRRSGDRRRYGRRPKFPLIDSDGNFVPRNRRRLVDRRYHDEVSSEADAEGAGKLALEYRHHHVVVKAGAPGLSLGRHSDCHLIVKAHAVSRHHAQIEFHEDRFYLIDRSTNGTYVRNGSGEVVHVVADRLPLSGEGVISLGIAPDEEGADPIRYSC